MVPLLRSGAEGEVVQLHEPTPNRLMYNYRLDGPMVPECPGGASTCPTEFGRAISCGKPSIAGAPSPHHCRAQLFSDDFGLT